MYACPFCSLCGSLVELTLCAARPSAPSEEGIPLTSLRPFYILRPESPVGYIDYPFAEEGFSEVRRSLG